MSSDSNDVMGKDDFLTLLVAQLENQDPMNPEDATEFTAQLAQFSSLEQLYNMNDSMTELATTQKQSDRFGTMALIGKEVVYADSSFTFDGDPVTVGYQLDGTADSVSMSVQDENGLTVATLHPTEITQGDHFLKWDGLNNDGTVVPDGKYDIILQASSAGENSTIAVSPLVQSEVTGVNFSNDTGDAVLQTLAGAEINSSSIIAVYQPDKTYSRNTTTNDEDSLINDGAENLTSDVTETSTSQVAEESSSTDEEQIEQDLLQYYLAG
jgi:flagellar basal-body rod modification protein FlgD